MPQKVLTATKQSTKWNDKHVCVRACVCEKGNEDKMQSSDKSKTTPLPLPLPLLDHFYFHAWIVCEIAAPFSGRVLAQRGEGNEGRGTGGCTQKMVCHAKVNFAFRVESPVKSGKRKKKQNKNYCHCQCGCCCCSFLARDGRLTNWTRITIVKHARTEI